jgi:hypothetical protein
MAETQSIRYPAVRDFKEFRSEAGVKFFHPGFGFSHPGRMLEFPGAQPKGTT